MKEITPRSGINATVTVPGSKSLTQRALLVAALADGRSELLGPLDSEDTEYTSMALQAMGIQVQKQKDRWLVDGRGGRIATPAEPIYLGNNGTATRFLTSFACLGNGLFRIVRRQTDGRTADRAADAGPARLGGIVGKRQGHGLSSPGDPGLRTCRRQDPAAGGEKLPVSVVAAAGGPVCQAGSRTGGGGRGPFKTLCRHDPGGDGGLRA